MFEASPVGLSEFCGILVVCMIASLGRGQGGQSTNPCDCTNRDVPDVLSAVSSHVGQRHALGPARSAKRADAILHSEAKPRRRPKFIGPIARRDGPRKNCKISDTRAGNA